MKFSQGVLSAVLMAAVAYALPVEPVEQVEEAGLVPRQRGCADISVIFARGTTEPGTLGVAVGPQFAAALRSAAGGQSVDFDGVDYPAVVAGFLVGGDRRGSATMASMVAAKAAACPDTAIVMSGYSQGGQLVHNAARQLDASVAARVNAAVIFGDPNNGDALAQISADRTLVICHIGDNICDGGAIILPPHLNYAIDVGRASRFVMSKV